MASSVVLIDRARAWLDRPAADTGWAPPRWRRLGIAWVAVTLPVTTAVSALVTTPEAWVAVVVVLGFGAYTVPGLPAGLHAVRHAAPADRPGYRALWLGQVATVASGAGAVLALAAGSGRVLAALPAALAVAGALHIAGLALVVRRRSGQQALSVDVAETLAVVVAVAAPLAVLWWPDLVGAERAWFALSAATVFLFTVAGAYWVALLWVRLGPGPRRGLERSEVGGGVVAVAAGSVTAALQAAQGATDFALPGPPLALLTALCGSTYLLIPLHAPQRWRGAFEALPPEAQVRGGWLPTLIPLAGIAALLATTAAVAGERPGAVPFALAAVVVLAVLGAVRQVATLRETRRLYGQVAATAGERRRLLAQLLERTVDDRRFAAEHLHRQALSAYASFAALAADQVVADRPPAVVARASAVIGDELRRRADSLHDLVRSMRPRDGGRRDAAQVVTSVRAYAATLYGDGPAPALAVDVAEGLALDWVAETVLLQVVQEALDNVHRHGRATSVRVAVESRGGVAWARVTDDGAGFDTREPAGTGGIATMQAAAAVIDGQVWVESRPGRGTTVVVRLGAAPAGDPDGPSATVLPFRPARPPALPTD